jgi:hypothetical protein
MKSVFRTASDKPTEPVLFVDRLGWQTEQLRPPMSDFVWFLAKEHHGSDLAIHVFDTTVQLAGPT